MKFNGKSVTVEICSRRYMLTLSYLQNAINRNVKGYFWAEHGLELCLAFNFEKDYLNTVQNLAASYAYCVVLPNVNH